MQLRLNNLLPSGNTWSSAAKRGLFFTLIFFQFLTPSVAMAISPGKAAAIPQVAAALALILELNRRMERASLNPMNENYRNDVKHAVSLLPGAIVAIAMVFKAGKQLHDADLPVVQALLGGFVDVSAPDRYKEFFKRPDKSLIPNLGANIPPDIKPAQLGPAPAGPDKAVAPGVTVASTGPVNMSSNDVVSLNDRWSPKGTAEAPRTGNTESYGYDESAAKAATGGEASPEIAGATQASGGSYRAGATNSYGYDEGRARNEQPSSTQFMQQVASDLGSIESRMAQVGMPVRTVPAAPALAPSEVSSDNTGFFQKMKQDGDEEAFDEDDAVDAGPKRAVRKKKGVSRVPASEAAKKYKIKLKPKYWNLAPVSEILESFITSAHAEGECQECQGGKGGGGGGSAGEILMGVAAIIAAIAPMVVAGIQAAADKAIAKINADTTIKTAQLQSDTSKYLANTQKDVALQQAAMSQQIAKQNNDAQSQRLNMQLAELRSAREDASRAEQEKRAIEQAYNRERIDLAKKQADDNLKLAKQTLNANLTQAGLVSGASAKNSSSGLSVTNSSLTSTRSSGTSVAANSAGTGGVLSGGGATGPQLGAVRGTSSGSGSSSGGLGVRQAASSEQMAQATKTSAPLIVGTSRGAGASQLLSQFGGAEGKSPEELAEEEEQLRLRGISKTRRGRAAAGGRSSSYSRGVASVNYSADAVKVSSQLMGSLAPGSSAARGVMNRIPVALNDSGNGLRDFREAATAGAVPARPAVPYWKGVGDGEGHSSGRAAAPAPTLAGGHSPNQDPYRGAYRAPDFSE